MTAAPQSFQQCPVCGGDGEESLHRCHDTVSGRIAAQIRALQPATPATATYKTLRWARPLGATMDSMRKHVWETGLADAGDTILLWVNEGDFWHLMLNGCELKEHKNPDPTATPATGGQHG